MLPKLWCFIFGHKYYRWSYIGGDEFTGKDFELIELTRCRVCDKERSKKQ